MERIIKFRGQRVDNKEWIFGYLFQNHKSERLISMILPNKNGIDISNENEVIPETVGQFIGLPDKSGAEIYEGDILKIKDDITGEIFNTNVIYHTEFVQFALRSTHNSLNFMDCEDYEIVGNIYQTPDLLT